MHEPTVAHVHLGRFHQPLAEIRMPRRKPSNEQQTDEQVDVRFGGFDIHVKIAREVRDIEQSALMVCQHRPQLAHATDGDSWSEERNVALEVCANKIVSPAQTACVAGRQKAFRRSPANLQLITCRRRCSRL